MDLNGWLQIAKEYGPFIAGFALYAFWTSRQIDKLLDRNREAYTGEIQRLSKQLDRMTDHVLGPRQSSTEVPSLTEVERQVAAESPAKRKGDKG